MVSPTRRTARPEMPESDTGSFIYSRASKVRRLRNKKIYFNQGNGRFLVVEFFER